MGSGEYRGSLSGGINQSEPASPLDLQLYRNFLVTASPTELNSILTSAEGAGAGFR